MMATVEIKASVDLEGCNSQENTSKEVSNYPFAQCYEQSPVNWKMRLRKRSPKDLRFKGPYLKKKKLINDDQEYSIDSAVSIKKKQRKCNDVRGNRYLFFI